MNIQETNFIIRDPFLDARKETNEQNALLPVILNFAIHSSVFFLLLFLNFMT